MSTRQILDILGIEPKNEKAYKHLIPQFLRLAKKYGALSIWMKDDYGIYAYGRIVGKTKDLVAVI